MDEIRKMLLELYSPEDAERWLDSPQPLLAGGQPRAMIKHGDEQRVKDVLQSLLDGAYL